MSTAPTPHDSGSAAVTTFRTPFRQWKTLKPEEIRQAFCAGLGPKFTYVQLESRETVDRTQLDLQQWRPLIADTWGAALYVFAGELSDGSELYARMFAPAMGIAEDPATGAAAAAIVGAGAT